MKNYFLAIIMVLSVYITPLFSQNLQSEWGYAITGNGAEQSIALTVGSDGSVYSIGQFQYVIDVDPTDSSSIDLISAGSYDIFIQKRSTNGDLEWTKRIGNHHYESVYDITIDNSDNVYITGAFLGTVDFDPGPSEYNLSTLSNTAGTNIFILKLDSDGDFVWAKNIGSTHNDVGRGITADSQNNIYVTGRFKYTVDFDPGPAEYNQTTSYSGSTFILKLDQDGDFIWVRSFQQTLNFNHRNEGYGIITDNNGDIITFGKFKGTVDFKPGSGTFNITGAYSGSSLNTNLFIQKMTSEGDFVWAKHLSGVSYNNDIKDIATNSFNDVIIAGRYSSTVDFDPSPTVTNAIIGNKDGFVLSLHANGEFNWVNTFVSTYGNVITNGITVDPYNNIYTTGHFENTTNFTANTPTAYNVTSSNYLDAFIHITDQNGTFSSCNTLGTIGADRGHGIGLDQDNNVIISGVFQRPVDIDFSSDTDTLFSNGLTIESFLIKYSQCDKYYTDNQTVCDSLLWIDGEVYTSNNSTAIDTLTTVNGCDSIVYLNLTVLDKDTTIDTQQACGSYTWIDGVTYTENVDSIYHILTNIHGCDSVIELNLTIHLLNTTNLIDTICQNGEYIVGSSTYTTSGNYTDTLTNIKGCDSIVNLDLTVNPIYTINLTEIICANDNYLVGNSHYQTTGNYTDTLTTFFGCDSIINLNLTVNPIHVITLTESICQGDNYVVGTSNYSNSGNYSDTLSNVFGCDSIVNLDLTVNLTHSVALTESICIGDHYMVGGSNYSTTGDYSDTLSNKFGCDSIVNLDLTVNPTHNMSITEIICLGDHYMVGNSIYVNTGSYSDTLTNIFGCDSIINLNLTVNPTHNIILTESICYGDNYMVGSSNYTNTGNYADTLSNVYGCDSIVNLNLTVNPIYTTNLIENICIGENYMVGSSNYSTTGNYSDTLSNIYGCDSIVNLDLTVNPTHNINLTEVICNNDNYLVGNSSYNTSGSYSDTLSNIYGCDSIINLNLTVNPTHNIILTESICYGDNYMVGSSNYTNTGNYADTLSNVYGCDSIVNLNLTVNPIYTTNLIENICIGENYMVGSSNYSTTGNYSDTLNNIYGCDSIVNLDLTVNPTHNINLTEVICNNDNYLVGNSSYNTSGSYSDTLSNIYGCDSIINLNLTVNSTHNINLVDSICENDSYMVGDTSYNSTGIYSDTLSNIYGCDSIVNLELTVISIDESISINGFELTSNQSNADYQWLSCPDYLPIENATQQNFTPSLNGEYALKITYNDCIDTTSCQNISGIEVDKYSLDDLFVYPNPFKDKLVLQYNNKENIQNIIIHNINGKKIFQTHDINLMSEIPTSLWHAGSYIATIQLKNGNTKNILMIKHN